jgi:hypothetical protein
MSSALARLRTDKRPTYRLSDDLEFLSRGVDDNPAKSLGPPLHQGHRVYRVNNYLFP